MTVLRTRRGAIGYERVTSQDRIGKVPLIGSGPRACPEVFATIRDVPARERVPYETFRATDTRLFVLCLASRLVDTVRALHRALVRGPMGSPARPLPLGDLDVLVEGERPGPRSGEGEARAECEECARDGHRAAPQRRAKQRRDPLGHRAGGGGGRDGGAAAGRTAGEGRTADGLGREPPVAGGGGRRL
ncbi:aspartate kinase, partial [Streptomyces sparsogenes DSM 40356]